MIIYLREFNERKKAVFAALSRAEGGGRGVLLPLSFRDWPETKARVEKALSRAKRRPSGLSGWLKRQMLRGAYNWARGHFLRHPDRVAVAWNGMGGQRMAFLAGARDAGAPVLHAELAPLPGRITLDPAGVNAESSVPREAGFFRDWALGHPDREGEGWRAMGEGLVARPSRRSDVRQWGGPLPEVPFLFCPLQVPTDSQVSLFAGWCGGMDGFLAALTEAVAHLPEGWHLRLKEHPSARAALGPMLAPLVATGRAILDNDSDSFAQLVASRGVVTLNSSMGLQAFFHDKPVVVVGRAFFARPGLTSPAVDQPGLNRLFSEAPALAFDAGDRARFMNWLDQVYYPRFDPARPDAAALAPWLDRARINRAAKA